MTRDARSGRDSAAPRAAASHGASPPGASPPGASPWWDRARHADRRPGLLARVRITRALRAWFDAADFTPVECAQLVPTPGGETHLHAFATTADPQAGGAADRPAAQTGAGRRLYLHTSPEFAAKRLLAAGETQIVDFARVFRNRERGPLHAPEFTMIEWYRAHASLETVMADAVALLRVAAAATDGVLTWKGRRIDPAAPVERLSVGQAFQRYAGLDLFASITADGAPERARLAASAAAIGVHARDDDTWSDLFSRILTQKIEPHLGWSAPCLLVDYPLCEAALARQSLHDPRVAERFELYVGGVELANGFGELTDPDEQRRRFLRDMDEKERRYGERYPIDEDFLAALAHMPPASGVALGLDRLVMLAVGAQRIDQVQWTPPIW